VVILGEDALARSALAGRLAGQAQVSVIAQVAAAVGEAAVVEHEPDVVLWDMGLHAHPSIAALRAWEGSVPVLALADDARAAVDLLGAGAHGALARDAAPARLSAALVAVAHDLRVTEPVAEQTPTRPLPAADLSESLTPREREVVNLLAEGLSNKAIGERLAISEHTAKFHVNAILGKLGAASRTDAVMRAVRLGLILV
jgi:DNA-binding NarL/FixJ family response regulator